MELLNGKGVPSGAILSLEAALTQPQVAHRASIGTVCVEGIGEVKMFNLPAKFDRTPAAIEAPPPGLSDDTAEILGSVGYSTKDVARLKAAGVV